MELKILLKNTYHLASVRVIRFIIGLIRAKFNALFLGQFGLGIVSQILFINGRLNEITLLGMNDGVVKQLASRKDDPLFKYQILNCFKGYVFVVMITTVVITLFATLFYKQLTVYFFGDILYSKYYFVSFICLPIAILNTVSFALLKSFKLIDKIARGEIISSLIVFILFLPLVYYFHLIGAIVVIILNVLLILILNYYYSKNYVLNDYSISYLNIINKGKIISNDLKELIMFGGYGLGLGTYQMVIVIIKRSILVSQLGVESIGLYAPNIAWAGLFTGLILPTIRHYLYPRFSEIKQNLEIIGVVNDAFRLTSFIMVPFLFGGIAFRRAIIPIFYSRDFIDAAIYLPGHFLGTLFFMWMNILIMVYTPTGRIQIYALMQFILQTINLAIALYIIPNFGLYGYMITFLTDPVLFIIVSFIYFRKAFNFKVSTPNLSIMLYLILNSILLYFISEHFVRFGYLLGIILIHLPWFLLAKHEKKYITYKIKDFLSLKN